MSNVLSEELVLEVLRQLRHRLAERAKTTTSDVPQIEKESATLRAEIGRLVTALASTDQQPEAIVRAVAERQDQLSALEARLRAAKAAPEAIQLEVRRMEAEARAMLERNPEEARHVDAVPGPPHGRPERHGRGEAVLDRGLRRDRAHVRRGRRIS